MEFSLEHAYEILERTPGTLNSMLRGVSDAWIRPNEGGESWSAFNIVGHMVHCDQNDWIARAQSILEFGEPRSFVPVDRTAMFQTLTNARPDDLLDMFREIREHNLEQLRAMNLTPELLEHTGTHPRFGRVTLRQLLSTWVVHDLSHTAQIARVMSKQYLDAVGPWQEYLPILHARTPVTG
jgi:uncharacterized damage-inducible protein DinB